MKKFSTFADLDFITKWKVDLRSRDGKDTLHYNDLMGMNLLEIYSLFKKEWYFITEC